MLIYLWKTLGSVVNGPPSSSLQYRYYRDLISFRNKGDPKSMLRTINPVEAAMMDRNASCAYNMTVAQAIGA